MAVHPDAKAEIENLKQRIRALEAQMGEPPVEEELFTMHVLGKHLSFSGLLELEANYNKTEGSDDESDLTLATAELATEAVVNDNLAGHIILLYEEEDGGDDSTDVDEAVTSQWPGTWKRFGCQPTRPN